MIRFRRLPLAALNAWLVTQTVASGIASYRLRLWREHRPALAALSADLALYLNEAFEDARARLRSGFDDALSPFNDPALDPAANYPRALHRVTLQGYFGETLGVIAVEHWGAHGHNDWKVPALLFRFHDTEFQHLEQINERIRSGEARNPDEETEIRPGRTGDDGLAFRIAADGTITDILSLEAKCLSVSAPRKIAEAHRKLAAAGALPSGIRELINILADYDTPLANSWQQALITLRAGASRTTRRFDGVAYACGRQPALPRLTWLSAAQPDPNYNVGRGLEALEFQFTDLRGVVDLLYRGA